MNKNIYTVLKIYDNHIYIQMIWLWETLKIFHDVHVQFLFKNIFPENENTLAIASVCSNEYRNYGFL